MRVQSFEINNMKKMKSKKLNKQIKKIAHSFKKVAGKSLKYVMVPQGTHKKIIAAFQKRKITVITPNAVSAKNLTKASSGLFVVDSSKKDDVKAVLKAVKAKTMKTVSLAKCIPTGSKVDTKSAEKSKRMNAVRAGDESTDAETTESESTVAEATVKPENTDSTTVTAEQKTAAISTASSGASALTASSFVAIAAVSAVAMMML